MLKKIKNFFIKLIPTKRRLIQLYAALLYNANIKGFVTGKIFEGDSKTLCVPGLNCYSCPGAIGACPLGSIQNALASSKTKYPTYVIGIILLYSIILGRTICGYLCPFGLIQELLYKIKTPKLKKNKVTRILSYFKYILLVVLVILIPLIYGLQSKSFPVPGFCKYICPAGTLEGGIFLLSNPNNTDFFGMLGQLFTWKFALLVIFVVASIFIFRFFCRFFCPLGALYGLFNKLSILGVKVDKSKCSHCQACVNSCKMDVKEVGDHECINCGECKKVCHCNAISWKMIDSLLKEDKEESLEVIAIDSDINSDNESIQNEETTQDIEIKENPKAKKKKISKRRLFNIITSVIALAFLIFVLVYVNFFDGKSVYKINEVCDKVVVETFDGTSFDIDDNENHTILYFYEDFDIEIIEQLANYSDEKLNIVAISSYENKDINQTKVLEFDDYNIIFAYDVEDNTNNLYFTSEATYPYFVYLDHTDKIILKQDTFITDEEYIGIIAPALLGKTVGNKVGDICINQNVGIMDSNETFSVVENRGKIVIINFWYTECGPCLEELPHFNALYEEYRDYVEMIAIHEGAMYAENPQEKIDFINNEPGVKDYSFIFGYDTADGSYFKALGGKSAFPMTIIVDQDGVITCTTQGKMEEEQLRAEIEKLL